MASQNAHPPGTPPLLGIIGGSGVYEIDGLRNVQWQRVLSPWGEPSDELMFGELDGQRLVFLPRHGRGHRIPPSQLNYRANIDVLKRAGCTELLSVSAVGSLREDLPPGSFVVCDQFIDRSFAREKSFFGPGCVAHVSMADPVCRRMGDALEAAGRAAGIALRRGGTYLTMEGPQFSTRAESRLYRQWGCDVIGMTNMPEAKLAREAELPYATLAMVTDYDCWRAETEAVTVTNVLEIMHQNSALARQAIVRLANSLNETPRTPSPQGIETCLDFALITAPEVRDPVIVAKLQVIAGRALGG